MIGKAFVLMLWLAVAYGLYLFWDATGATWALVVAIMQIIGIPVAIGLKWI